MTIVSYCCADLFGASKHGGRAGGTAVPGSEAGGGGPQALHRVKQVETQHWETIVPNETHTHTLVTAGTVFLPVSAKKTSTIFQYLM